MTYFLHDSHQLIVQHSFLLFRTDDFGGNKAWKKGGADKAKKGGNNDYAKRRTQLRVTSSRSRNNNANRRGSLKKKNRDQYREQKIEKDIARRTIKLPE